MARPLLAVTVQLPYRKRPKKLGTLENNILTPCPAANQLLSSGTAPQENQVPVVAEGLPRQKFWNPCQVSFLSPHARLTGEKVAQMLSTAAYSGKGLQEILLRPSLKPGFIANTTTANKSYSFTLPTG